MSINQGLGRAFRHRSFVALWISSTIATFGDSFYRIALAWWVLEETGSGLAMGTVMICGTIPQVPFLLIGGVLSDRANRAKIMGNVMFLRALLSGTLAVLAITGHLEIWHVYIAATLFGTLSGFYVPALQAVVPQVVPQEDRASANSIRALTRQMCQIAGPFAAAAIVSTGANWIGFAVHSVAFGMSAFSLQFLRKLVVPVRPAKESTFVVDIRDGFAYVKREPWLWVSILAFLVINPATNPMFSVVMSFLIIKVLQYDGSGLAVAEATIAIGTVIAGLWLGRLAKLPPRGWMVYVAVAGQGAVFITFPHAGSLWALAGLAGLAGFLGSAYTLAWMNMMQDFVPAEQFGRVSSLDQVGAIITIPVGLALAGWALDRVDIALVCAVCGGLSILSAIAALAHPKIRAID